MVSTAVLPQHTFPAHLISQTRPFEKVYSFNTIYTMKFAQTCALAASFGVALASPVVKRQAINDGEILNYALTLEYLEAAFYKEGLANYTEADFEAAGFYGVRDDVVAIGGHEQTHATFLNSTLLSHQFSNLQLLSLLPVLLLQVRACTVSLPRLSRNFSLSLKLLKGKISVTNTGSL